MLSSALPLIFNSYPSPDFKVTVDKLVFHVLLYLATWHPTQTAPTCLACHKSLLSHRFPKWARQPQRRRNMHQIFRLPAVTLREEHHTSCLMRVVSEHCGCQCPYPVFPFLFFFSHYSASANLIYNHEHQMNVCDRTWWDLSWFIVSLLIVRGQASRGQWSLSLSANRFCAPVRLLKLCPSCFPSFSSGNLKEIYSLEGKLDWLSF